MLHTRSRSPPCLHSSVGCFKLALQFGFKRFCKCEPTINQQVSIPDKILLGAEHFHTAQKYPPCAMGTEQRANMWYSRSEGIFFSVFPTRCRQYFTIMSLSMLLRHTIRRTAVWVLCQEHLLPCYLETQAPWLWTTPLSTVHLGWLFPQYHPDAALECQCLVWSQ